MEREVWIVGAARTPLGRFLGSLSSLSATDLGGIAIKEALKRSGLEPKEVEEVIMGCVLQGGVGQAPARQASIKAGLPPEVPSFTINKVCGSGLRAITLGAQIIRSGEADVVIAGGMESMSNAPFAISDMRKGRKFGDTKLLDLMVYDGLWDYFNDCHMGVLADYTARKSGISREEQDQFAYDSHMKAVRAQEEGLFDEEIVEVRVEEKIVQKDEGPRKDTSLEKLSSLPPVFEKEGTVTAGNASSLNDGGAAVILVSSEKGRSLGLTPLAKIRKYASSFVDPKELFYAPVHAIRKVVKLCKLSHVNEFDLIEINEAFASQVLADVKELRVDISKLNIKGGAIALGHPIGASGARIVVTLIYSLIQMDKEKGLAALCLGGGGAVALAIER